MCAAATAGMLPAVAVAQGGDERVARSAAMPMVGRLQRDFDRLERRFAQKWQQELEYRALGYILREAPDLLRGFNAPLDFELVDLSRRVSESFFRPQREELYSFARRMPLSGEVSRTSIAALERGVSAAGEYMAELDSRMEAALAELRASLPLRLRLQELNEEYDFGMRDRRVVEEERKKVQEELEEADERLRDRIAEVERAANRRFIRSVDPGGAQRGSALLRIRVLTSGEEPREVPAVVPGTALLLEAEFDLPPIEPPEPVSVAVGGATLTLPLRAAAGRAGDGGRFFRSAEFVVVVDEDGKVNP
jgi:hypothetical protein